MSVLYITSLDKGAGKTALCITLSKRLQNEGKKIGYLKPLVISDKKSDYDADTNFLNNILCVENAAQIMPVNTDVSGLKEALKNSDNQLWKEIYQKFLSVSQGKDVIIVEGLSCVDSELLLMSAKIADQINGKTLIMAKYSPSFSVESLQSSVKPFGANLIGTVINFVPKNRNESLKAAIAAAKNGIKLTGTLPEERILLSPSVSELCEFLNGKILNSENKGNELVENFMVGAMSVDSGVDFLSRKNNKAVITRGDRPDLQLAALNTSTRCIVATANMKPVDNVLLWAKDKKIPFILVEKGTASILDQLTGIVDKVSIHNEARAEKFAQIVNQNIDLKTILKVI